MKHLNRQSYIIYFHLKTSELVKISLTVYHSNLDVATVKLGYKDNGYNKFMLLKRTKYCRIVGSK
jgi:hypothetical protein